MNDAEKSKRHAAEKYNVQIIAEPGGNIRFRPVYRRWHPKAIVASWRWKWLRFRHPDWFRF